MSQSSFGSSVAPRHTDATIVASARDIHPNSIVQYNDTQFDVASQSHPGAFHSVDLNLSTCDCQDFPKIRFCKHIAAVRIHFDPDESDLDSSDVYDPKFTPAPRKETPQTLAQEIMVVCHVLASKTIDESHRIYPSILEALRSAKFRLLAALATEATHRDSALSGKNRITPNRKSRGETPAPAPARTTGGVERALAPKR
jgi:hypothetical protein